MDPVVKESSWPGLGLLISQSGNGFVNGDCGWSEKFHSRFKKPDLGKKNVISLAIRFKSDFLPKNDAMA